MLTCRTAGIVVGRHTRLVADVTGRVIVVRSVNTVTGRSTTSPADRVLPVLRPPLSWPPQLERLTATSMTTTSTTTTTKIADDTRNSVSRRRRRLRPRARRRCLRRTCGTYVGLSGSATAPVRHRAPTYRRRGRRGRRAAKALTTVVVIA